MWESAGSNGHNRSIMIDRASYTALSPPSSREFLTTVGSHPPIAANKHDDGLRRHQQYHYASRRRCRHHHRPIANTRLRAGFSAPPSPYHALSFTPALPTASIAPFPSVSQTAADITARAVTRVGQNAPECVLLWP